MQTCVTFILADLACTPPMPNQTGYISGHFATSQAHWIKHKTLGKTEKKFMRFSHHSTSTSNKINSHFFRCRLFIYLRKVTDRVREKNMVYHCIGAAKEHTIFSSLVIHWVCSRVCQLIQCGARVSKRPTSACDWECILSSRWALSLLHQQSKRIDSHICAALILTTHFIELLNCSFYFTWTFSL